MTNESLRLIIDTRPTNAAHARPPLSRLSTVSALASIDISDGANMGAHQRILPPLVKPCLSSVDMWNGFDQFRISELGSHFAMNYPEQAGYYRVDRVYNELTGEFDFVSPETPVFPVFEGMAMGWSWALYFCHSTVSLAAMISSPLAAADRRPGPTPTASSAVRCPYVDNANLIGVNKESVQRAVDEAERD